MEDEGDRLTDAEIISTVIVLLNAGHEATVNTLGNGMRAFLLHPRRVAAGHVAARCAAAVAIEEMIRWDAPLQLFERWVLDDGVEIAGQPLARRRARWRCCSARPTAIPAASPTPIASTPAAATAPTSASAAASTSASVRRWPARSSTSRSTCACIVPDLQLAAAPVYQPTFVIRGLQALPLEAGHG